MRKFIVLPLLVLLVACTDDGAIMPVGPDGPLFAKKCPSPPCDKGGGGGGDAEGEYTITDLGTLFDGKSSSSWARDLSGVVGGTVLAVGASRSNTNAPSVATLWTVTAEGVATATELVITESEADGVNEANGINSNGTIAVGRAGSWENIPPVWWDAGQNWLGQELTPLGSGDGVARGVNNGGQIVGWSVSEFGVSFDYRATLWDVSSTDQPEPQDLHRDGWRWSWADDINGSGVVVGRVSIDNPLGLGSVTHAVLWNTGNEPVTACDLHIWDLPPKEFGPGDVLRSHAHSVSESSNDGFVIVAGSKALYSGEGVAVVWQVKLSECGQSNALQAVELAHSADAYGVNVDVVNGIVEVVGIDVSSGNDKPVVWKFGGFDGSPPVVEQILPSLKGGHGAANAISGDHIVGRTKAGQGNHAVLWTKKTQ